MHTSTEVDPLEIPVKQRIWMTQGHRLPPECPNRQTLIDWCTNGRLVAVVDQAGRAVYNKDGTVQKEYLVLESRIDPGGRRYTWPSAYHKYKHELQHRDWRRYGKRTAS